MNNTSVTSNIPHDYKVKPLKQYERPYFSPKLGSWEIDIVFSEPDSSVKIR
jgi:hypothetical protein